MAYQKIGWQNKPSAATPITAARLKHMDEGIYQAHAQLAQIENQSATKIEVDVERKRIDLLIAPPAGIDNAETSDIRVGADGILYDSAGDAVRKQVGKILNKIDEIKEALPIEYYIPMEEWTTGYWRVDGTENTTNELYKHIKIPVNPRDKIKFTARNDGNIVTGVYLDINNTVLSYFGNKIARTYTDEIITVPSGAVYLCLSAYVKEHQYSVYIEKPSKMSNNYEQLQWKGKKWVAYGDSITAISNSDLLNNSGWTSYVNEILKFGSFHGRVIGGSGFRWRTSGGAAAVVNATTGMYVSRNDAETKETYTGTVGEGNVLIRSCFCSWDRITHMIPESIRKDVDLVFIMGGTNDDRISTAPTWIVGDTTDPEWAASDFYSIYGGDYNIEYMQGGIASCVMKMQLWCPNAVIVIGTPLASRGTTGTNRTDITAIEELEKTQYIKSVAEMLACPCINVYGTSGINPLNRADYITDTLHPYSESGKMMLARAVAGGLKMIYPKLVLHA